MKIRRTPFAVALLAAPVAIALAACSSGPAPAAAPVAKAPLQVQTVAGTTERGQLSTHILDTGIGRPASGVDVSLEVRDSRKHTWKKVAEGVTDEDGRIEDLGGTTLPEGAYRVTLETEAYFAAQKKETFFPEVTIDFYISDNTQHYHVPLLLSPFAYSTYRGS